MNPEVLYSKFLEKSGGDVHTAVLMVWAVADATEGGRTTGPGPVWIWYQTRGKILLGGLDKQGKLNLKVS